MTGVSDVLNTLLSPLYSIWSKPKPNYSYREPTSGNYHIFEYY